MLPATEESPRNKMANSANVFNAAWKQWADLLNAFRDPGTYPAKEPEAWEPIPRLIRTVERLRRNWAKGF